MVHFIFCFFKISFKDNFFIMIDNNNSWIYFYF